MKERRISTPMSWALVVLVLILGYVGIANPLLALYAERRATIELLGEMVADRTALIARRQALEDRRQALSQDQGGKFEIIPERDTTAVARLQEHLRLAAAARGLRVDTLQVLPDRAVAPLREVAVRASLSGSVIQIQRLLHSLESGSPMIKIPRLTLLGRPGTPDLEITLEIAALAESPKNGN